MERSRTLSEGTAAAMNEIDDMLNNEQKQTTGRPRKVSEATQEALDFIGGKLQVDDVEEDDLPPTPDSQNRNSIPKAKTETKSKPKAEAEPKTKVEDKTKPENEHEPKLKVEENQKLDKKKVTEKLHPPIDKGRQSIHYVLTAEEKAILFQGRDFEKERENREEKSALTCTLLLMFEEMEHQSIVYEKLMTSELFDESLRSLTDGQNLLLKKILKNS